MSSRLLSLFILAFMATSLFAQDKKEYETPHYAKRMAYFAENPIGGEGKIVFLGNSLTEGGKWSEYFPEADAVNRGIVGDNTEGMLNRIDEIVASKPRILFILTGINDISQDFTDEQIISNYRQILDRVKTDSPNTKIYVESILPINNDFARYKKLTGKEQQVISYNKALKRLCKQEKVKFLDIHSSFGDENGKLKKEITTDGLHLNEAGYTIWAKILKKYVTVGNK